MSLNLVEKPQIDSKLTTLGVSRITSENPLVSHISKQLVAALSRRNLSTAEIERIRGIATKVDSIFQLCVTSKLEIQNIEALSEMHRTLLTPYIPEFSELEISRKNYDWMKLEVRRCMKSASQTASA